MAIYLTVEDVKHLHTISIELYGGSLGIRDEGALESALARPQMGYYADIIAEAAALMESLIQNHPFIDGNKRVAFLATKAFLDMNGRRVEGDEMEIYHQIMELFDTNKVNFATIEEMLHRLVV